MRIPCMNLPRWMLTKGEDGFLHSQTNHSGVLLVMLMVTFRAELLILVYCSLGTIVLKDVHWRSSAVALVVLMRMHVAVKFVPISTNASCGAVTTNLSYSEDQKNKKKLVLLVIKHWLIWCSSFFITLSQITNDTIAYISYIYELTWSYRSAVCIMTSNHQCMFFLFTIPITFHKKLFDSV